MGRIKAYLEKEEEHLITEAAYPNNIGFVEMAQFYQIASRKQLDEMEQIIKDENWTAFKKMIKKVLDVKLH